MQRLTDQAADRLELDVPQAWLGHHHRSYAQPLDGACLCAPPRRRKANRLGPPSGGLGFLLLQPCLVRFLGTAAPCGLELNLDKGTPPGKTVPPRRLAAGDVMLGDSYFCSLTSSC